MSGNPGGPSSILAHLPYKLDKNGTILLKSPKPVQKHAGTSEDAKTSSDSR